MPFYNSRFNYIALVNEIKELRTQTSNRTSLLTLRKCVLLILTKNKNSVFWNTKRKVKKAIGMVVVLG